LAEQNDETSGENDDESDPSRGGHALAAHLEQSCTREGSDFADFEIQMTPPSRGVLRVIRIERKL
jgi:hypothetical protein